MNGFKFTLCIASLQLKNGQISLIYDVIVGQSNNKNKGNIRIFFKKIVKKFMVAMFIRLGEDLFTDKKIEVAF